MLVVLLIQGRINRGDMIKGDVQDSLRKSSEWYVEEDSSPVLRG